MKHWYITFQFMTASGVSGTGFKVCESASKPSIAVINLLLCKQFAVAAVLNVIQITRDDYESFDISAIIVLTDDYKQRLLIEHSQLAKRIDKLEKFIKTDKFKELSIQTQSLMNEQFSHMSGYLRVLTKRCKLEGVL